MNYLKPAEVLKVLESAKKNGAREHAIVLLGYKHGLRASEIARLTLDDVRGGQINVRRLKGSLHTIQPLASHANPLLDEPTVLKAWLRERGYADGSQFLFTSRQGSALSRRQIYNLFEDAAIRAGIEKGRRNPHILKHSLASNLLRGGASVAYVQIALGHVDAKNTLRYTNVNDEEAAVVTGQTLDAIFATA
jgi:type 1 fimbriae regulatory protein FimB